MVILVPNMSDIFSDHISGPYVESTKYSSSTPAAGGRFLGLGRHQQLGLPATRKISSSRDGMGTLFSTASCGISHLKLR